MKMTRAGFRWQPIKWKHLYRIAIKIAIYSFQRNRGVGQVKGSTKNANKILTPSINTKQLYSVLLGYKWRVPLNKQLFVTDSSSGYVFLWMANVMEPFSQLSIISRKRIKFEVEADRCTNWQMYNENYALRNQYGTSCLKFTIVSLYTDFLWLSLYSPITEQKQ